MTGHDWWWVSCHAMVSCHVGSIMCHASRLDTTLITCVMRQDMTLITSHVLIPLESCLVMSIKSSHHYQVSCVMRLACIHTYTYTHQHYFVYCWWLLASWVLSVISLACIHTYIHTNTHTYVCAQQQLRVLSLYTAAARAVVLDRSVYNARRYYDMTYYTTLHTIYTAATHSSVTLTRCGVQ